MPAQRGNVEHLLERELGFQREEGDHLTVRLVIDGKLIARTKTSHSHSTIGDDLLGLMARQIHISPAFFKALLARKKRRNDYLKALQQRALLPPGI
ncbi:MAG TPA: hypothetical protein VGP33_10990 [Chloroflexota bacterium]|nr:hypothetical protein [Chloroflexota bacterium]